MTAIQIPMEDLRLRDLQFFRNPKLWPLWPYLPVMRRQADQSEPELGILYDAAGYSGTYGYSATVIRSNLFDLPSTEAQLLALPRFVYDKPEEMAHAGWTVD